MNNVTDLVRAPHNEVQETLKALQRAGLTLEDLKKIRSNSDLAGAIARMIHKRSSVAVNIALMDLILPPDDQISAWLESCNRGNFGISLPEFDAIPDPPALTDQDRGDGFVGISLFYGFGGEDGHSDMVLSGKIAWDYAASQRATQKWDAVKFNDLRYFKPRDEAHPRPSGFYWKKIQLGHIYQGKSVKRVINTLSETDWGMGPEGIQFLAITHPRYVEQLNGNNIPFIWLSDYEIAPNANGNFNNAPSLGLLSQGNILMIRNGLVTHINSWFGSGSLR